MKGKKKVFYFMIFFGLVFVCSACRSGFPGKQEQTVRDGVHLEKENIGGLNESQVLKIIDNYARKIDMDALDARMDENTWEIYRGREGKKVNVEKTLNKALKAEEGEKIDLEVETVYPQKTYDMLSENIVEIGSYSTPLLNRSESRINNIDLAADRINCYKLAPGEEFSFNRVVGKRTEAKGYEEAPIIIRTEDGPKKGYGVGGGVCQLSTTIFNAVEESGLEVTERHIHSKNVGYVPRGEDATVSYGKVDFKFRNNRSCPIMIRVSLTEKRVGVSIIENRNF